MRRTLNRIFFSSGCVVASQTLVILILSFITQSQSFIVFSNVRSQVKTLGFGDVKLHYSDPLPASCEVVVLGVGTAMSVNDYDKLSTAIAEYGHIVAVVDHNKNNMVKTDDEKFLNLATELKTQFFDLASDFGCKQVKHWLMGGHSASGQAAQNAIAANHGLADAVFSLDPFDASQVAPVCLPAMYWGFKHTTCFVSRNNGAAKVYEQGETNQALYQVNNKFYWSKFGYIPDYYHCSFCDSGFMLCSNFKLTPEHFYLDIAESVDRFIQAAFYKGWSKEALQLSDSKQLNNEEEGLYALFVNAP